MAADKRTAFLEAYRELKFFIPFLSTFFRTRPRDIVNAETVQIDVQRGTRKIAPVINSITAKGGKIRKSQYTQKEFTPPVVALGGDFAPGDLIEKAFGETEYGTAMMGYQSQLQMNMMDTMGEIEAEIMRNTEYQASQILQTGTMSLYDENGNVAFEIDFKPKASHFPTVTVNWSDANSDPDTDIISLYEQIKKDGAVNPRVAIFGRNALKNYLKNSDIKEKFDNRRILSGEFDPMRENPDVSFLGDLLVGYTKFECYLYEGYYEDPTDSTNTLEFVSPDSVILLPSIGSMNFDFRRIWCRVPTVTGVDPRFAGLIPSSMVMRDRQFTPRVWVSGDSDTLNLELKARPLLIPVSIDAFGCLDTNMSS
jgi:hypothetical protein